MFRNFVQPSYAALDEAFAALKEAGATELVIDVRYNGGGLVDVATHLAGLVGGPVTDGRVFGEFRHNDRNTRLNETLRFGNPPQTLTLQRLFVITTRSSASASELIINGLRPHIPVVVIGGTTFGKPVGQYGFSFCDKVLAPVSFSIVNADGQGDYFDGIAPDVRGRRRRRARSRDRRGSVAGRGVPLHPHGPVLAGDVLARVAHAAGPCRPGRAYGWHSLVNAY